MERIKQFIHQFCISTTGSLIGMIITVQFINPSTRLRLIDLWGLVIANFLIIGLLQVLFIIESSSKWGSTIRFILHYLGTMAILFGIAYKLQWLGIDQNQNRLFYGGVISIIYFIARILIIKYSYDTSKEINQALMRYQNRG